MKKRDFPPRAPPPPAHSVRFNKHMGGVARNLFRKWENLFKKFDIFCLNNSVAF